jgi:hypothetical protein
MPKFIFVRHGYSCSNSIGHLLQSDIIKRSDAKNLLKSPDQIKTVFNSNIKPLNDPVLTHLGVDASIHNGCIINKVLKSLGKSTSQTDITDGEPTGSVTKGRFTLQMENPRVRQGTDIDDVVRRQGTDFNIDKIHIIGCSPLIRAMETAYYMSRKWINPPNKIYVLPFLRELDEGSSDKFSETSIEKINTSPGYAMKSLQEQKDYLAKLGILNFFDFSFVEAFPEPRLQPGDIKLFFKWFATYYLPLVVEPVDDLNIFIVSHAGVLRDFTKTGFVNNSGFVINTTYKSTFLSKNLIPKGYILLEPYLNRYNFFKDYTNPIYNQEYYCPSERCGQLCSVINVKSDKLKTLNLECNIP